MLEKKKMTLDEFFAVLRQIKGWRLTNEGCDDDLEMIRKKSRSKKKIDEYCPITAVTQRLSRKVFFVGEAYSEAAKVIRLGLRDADRIISAADRKRLSKTRRRLLRATGLGQ